MHEVTVPAQLMRPSIGKNASCVVDDFAYIWACVANMRNTQYSLENHAKNHIAVNKKWSYVALCNA